MSVKGTSVIQLTDVKTGSVETYENSNIVTAAVPKALGLHVGLLERNYNIASNFSTMLPPVPNAIGGILCYEEALEENVNKLYAPANNKLVACASNDANNTVSTVRGSLNKVESGPLEDRKGYRFVFDFSTAQGNGTISALALTSKFGGISGFGDAVSPFSAIKNIGVDSINVSSTNYEGYIKTIVATYFVVGVRYDHNDLIAIVPFSNGELQIWSIPFPTTKVDLTGGIWHKGTTYKTLATIKPSINFWNGTSGQTQTSTFYGTFWDGGDGFWWGFSYRGTYSESTHTIYWAKINQETYQIEEGTWTINNVALRTVSCTAYSSTLATRYWYDDYYLKENNYTICGGGYLYMLNYNLDKVYKINLSNPTDVTSISIKKITETNTYGLKRPIQYIRYIQGTVYVPTGFIDTNNVFTEATASMDDFTNIPPVHRNDQVFFFGFGKETARTYVYAYLCTPYLATINNLNKPVLKTADKTMKITYILREE